MVGLIDGVLSLSFSTAAGAMYQLQTSTDFIDWSDDGAIINGNGGDMTFQPQPTAPAGQEFFRLRKL